MLASDSRTRGAVRERRGRRSAHHLLARLSGLIRAVGVTIFGVTWGDYFCDYLGDYFVDEFRACRRAILASQWDFGGCLREVWRGVSIVTAIDFEAILRFKAALARQCVGRNNAW